MHCRHTRSPYSHAARGVSSPVRWEKRARLGLFRATIARVVYAVAQRAAADRRSVPGTGLDHGWPAGGVESTISSQCLALARLPWRAARLRRDLRGSLTLP